jgi:dihydroflavonol-4-reductase
VLQAARDAQAGRFVYTSTLTTIGQSSAAGRLADERDFYVPGSSPSVYYESKFAMETEAFRAAAEGLPIVILNPTAVFGPGDVKPTTGEILLRVAKGQIPVYFEAVERGRAGQRYILGGHNLTLQELLTTTARVAGVRAPRWKLSTRTVNWLFAVGEGLRLPLPDLVKTVRFWQPLNDHKAQRELDHQPRPFEETARDTLAWFRENHYLP